MPLWCPIPCTGRRRSKQINQNEKWNIKALGNFSEFQVLQFHVSEFGPVPWPWLLITSMSFNLQTSKTPMEAHLWLTHLIRVLPTLYWSSDSLWYSLVSFNTLLVLLYHAVLYKRIRAPICFPVKMASFHYIFEYSCVLDLYTLMSMIIIIILSFKEAILEEALGIWFAHILHNGNHGADVRDGEPGVAASAHVESSGQRCEEWGGYGAYYEVIWVM